MSGYQREIEYDEQGTVRKVTERENITKFRSEEPEFYKVYTKMVSVLRNIPLSANSVLTELLMRMSYADDLQRVILNGEEIDIILKKTGISRSSFERQMTALMDRGVIYSKKKPTGKSKRYTGTFYVNPHFFAKGDWSKIRQFRSYIRLDAKGGSLLTETSTEEPVNAIDVETVKYDEGQQALLFERGEWLWELDRINDNKLPPQQRQTETKKKLQQTENAENEKVIETILRSEKE